MNKKKEKIEKPIKQEESTMEAIVGAILMGVIILSIIALIKFLTSYIFNL